MSAPEHVGDREREREFLRGRQVRAAEEGERLRRDGQGRGNGWRGQLDHEAELRHGVGQGLVVRELGSGFRGGVMGLRPSFWRGWHFLLL